MIRQFLLLILVMVYTIGCKTPGAESRQDVMEEPIEQVADLDYPAIKQRGYLTAIIDNSSTGLFIYKGDMMGYEYELLQLFAHAHGLELRIDITVNLEEAFEKLNAGTGDIMAYNLTITKDRKKRIYFTEPHNQVPQVLIQRKPENWRDLKLHELEATLVRNQVDLIGKEVYVRYQSAYLDRMRTLANEVGGDILIIEDFPNVDTETLIKKVANGEIDYTVAEEDIALVNNAYYPILDVQTPVSFPQQIGWGIRNNADSLKNVLDTWILSMKGTEQYNTIYNKYFKSTRNSLEYVTSSFSSSAGGQLSPYDSLIKAYAKTIGWDWRLLAAQIHRESRFDPRSKSWAGALGLMQVLPKTGREYGVRRLYNPEQNLKAGTSHIKWLEERWAPVVKDSTEMLKFVLGSYNVGHGHVFDARRLAMKYGEDGNKWEPVSEYLLKKSNAKYFQDPVVEFGYCRGLEPVTYVQHILERWGQYMAIYPDELYEN